MSHPTQEVVSRISGEAVFQALLESAPDAVIIADADGRILLANRQAEAVFGYDSEELVGQPIDDLVPARQRPLHAKHRADYAAAPVPRSMGAGLQLSARRKDGTEFPVDIALSALAGQSDGLLVMASVRDVTERRQLESDLRASKAAAEEANRAKSEFLSRMSHELRTPLNAVLGFAQLLELDQLSAEQKESVAFIRRAGSHLLELINEVLDIARIESGQLVLSNEPVALRTVIEACTPMIRPLAAARAISLTHPDPSSCDLFVLADQQRLRQVLLNLMGNAVKYNRQGGRVELAWERRGDSVFLEVRDTGPGIAPELLPRLFVPFDRLGAENVDIEGSGVGLTISLKLVEAMGGTLHVDSKVRAGSVFTVELPAAPDGSIDLRSAGPATSSNASQRDGEQALTLLYVEDNLSNVRLVERLVARRPRWNLVHALTGTIGIDLALSRRPGLVFLDLHLPDMTGTEVLHALRNDARTASTLMYVVSADATKGRRRQLMDAGADGYLTKPIDVTEMLALLDRVSAQLTGEPPDPPGAPADLTGEPGDLATEVASP